MADTFELFESTAAKDAYLAELKALRDEALVKSRKEGVRNRLGRVSFGKVTAEWEGLNGGDVTLPTKA